MSNHLFNDLRPAPPPADLRARVLLAAARAVGERPLGKRGAWSWLRPELGWMTAAALLLVAHALLDTFWPAGRRAQVARVEPAVSRPETRELAEVGIPSQLVADMASVSRARPALDPALVRELL